MADFEVHVDLLGQAHFVGIARRNVVCGAETVLFEYAPDWLGNPSRFALEPILSLTREGFPPSKRQSIFGSRRGPTRPRPAG